MFLLKPFTFLPEPSSPRPPNVISVCLWPSWQISVTHTSEPGGQSAPGVTFASQLVVGGQEPCPTEPGRAVTKKVAVETRKRALGSCDSEEGAAPRGRAEGTLPRSVCAFGALRTQRAGGKTPGPSPRGAQALPPCSQQPTHRVWDTAVCPRGAWPWHAGPRSSPQPREAKPRGRSRASVPSARPAAAPPGT